MAPVHDAPLLPSQSKVPFRKHFAHARLVVDSGPDHYTIVAPGKGGVVVHGRKQDSRVLVDAGAVGVRRGRAYTTQAMSHASKYELDGNSIIVVAPFAEAVVERPTPLKFLILRMLALTAFRNRWLTEIVKRMLVRRLITGQRLARGVNRREIRLGPDIEVVDRPSEDCDVQLIHYRQPFSAIHMASAGYWQRQDDDA